MNVRSTAHDCSSEISKHLLFDEDVQFPYSSLVRRLSSNNFGIPSLASAITTAPGLHPAAPASSHPDGNPPPVMIAAAPVFHTLCYHHPDHDTRRGILCGELRVFWRRFGGVGNSGKGATVTSGRLASHIGERRLM